MTYKACRQHGIANNSGVRFRFRVHFPASAFITVESDEARKSATVAIPGTLCVSIIEHSRTKQTGHAKL